MVHAALPRAVHVTFAFRSLAVLALTLSCDEPDSESVGSSQEAASCRAIELQVSRAPGQGWTTDEESLSPAMTFLLPERVEVTANNAGLHDVWLEIRNGEVENTCRYRARSKAVGQAHQFVACTSGAVPGDELDATWVGLSAEGSPATITLTLREELPCDGGGGGAGGGAATGGSGQGGQAFGGFGGSIIGTGAGGQSATGGHGGTSSGTGGAAQGGAGATGGGAAGGGANTTGGGGDGGTGGLSEGGAGGTGGSGGEGGSGGGLTCAQIVDDGDPCTIDRCDPSGALVRTTCNALDPTVPTTLADSLSFLFEQEPLVQTGVAPGTLDPIAIAGVTGRVLGPDGLALSNAIVTILGHPELGATLTDATGRYIMAVHPTDRLTIDVEAAGLLNAQRAVEAPLQQIAHAPDVMLSALNPDATVIDLAALTEVTAAVGSVESDEAGPRQGALLFEPGATAQLRFADGSTQPAPMLTVRITEVTVGADGPKRMPGELPPASAYTYAVDLHADEAAAAGAKHVELSAPASYFLENFIGAPVGTAVPAGTYDFDQAAWVPDPDGRVVQIVSVSAGLAELDVDGDGFADPAASAAALGISDDERAWLASRYPLGSELWHTEIHHFSTIDLNNMKGCPECEGPPRLPIASDDTCTAEEQVASVIECTNQTFGEDVPVAGTPYSLHYRSDRVPGRSAARRVTVPITDATVSPVLRAILVRLRVGGRQIEQRIECPCAPNDAATIEWDGLDLFGREPSGHQEAEVEVAYEYPWGSGAPAARPDGLTSFGAWAPGLTLDVDRVRNIAEIRSVQRLELGRSHNQVHGLGGFSLDAVHSYDLASRTLYRGDGSRRRGDAVTSTLEAVHVKSLIDVIEDSLALPDGGLLMSLHSGLYRRGPDGVDMKIGPGVSDGCTAAFEIPALQSCHAKQLTRLSLGPDGSLYALINSGSRIVRLRPNGVLSLVAGGTSGGESGDGGAATAALVSCRSLAAGDDGAVYCGGNSTVRRVGLDGIIRRVAGGTGTLSGDGLPAAQSRLGTVVDMAFLRDGALLLTEASLIAQLRAIGNDGILRCVAGCGSGPLTDGADARGARLERVAEAIEAADGTLYLTHTIPQQTPSGVVFRRTIRTIDHAGRLGTVAGVGGPECTSTSVQCGVGGPALSANFAPSSLSLGADSKLYGRTGNLVFRLSPDLPSYARSGFVITEADGRTAYRFDAAGRHLETFDADTGVVELTIEHDGDGHLSTLTDRDGLVTRVERGVTGAPLAIVGPYGQRTELSLDAGGYLARIEDPEGGAWIADYDDQGLLFSWTNRNGHQKTLAWETGGLLASVTDAALATTTLTGVTAGTDRAVTLESALGRARSYGLERAAGPSEIRTFTGAEGLTTATTRNGSGVATSVGPDGTTTSTQVAPDPRFGLAAPFISRESVTLPSGLTVTLSRERSVTLAPSGGDFDFISRTDTATIGGRTWTITHDGATREVATTSPEGRVGVELLDADGRVIEIHEPGALPITIDYDLDGRPSQVQQGARATSFTYGADGLLAAVTDPLGRTTTFTRDAVGRVLEERRPDLEATFFAYDLEGNATAVTPPGRPAHGMTHNLVELLETYDPPALPGGGPTSYSYDLDRALTAIEEPGPRLTEHHYDSAGRHSSTTYPGGAITAEYHPKTGHLTTLDGPDVTLHFSYDGARVTSVRMTGAVAGDVSWEHDNALRLTEERINGAHLATLAYDDDDLILQAGALTLQRDPATGFATQAHAGVVEETWTYDPYADVATATAMAGGVPILQLAYVRDDLGRILEQTENTPSGTRVLSYEHDELDRLRAVYEDGVLVEAYDFDANGNRLSALNEDGDHDATFDTRDRLLTHGGATFTWAPTGELLSRTDSASGDVTHYIYDALGNLKTVELPDGTEVDYLVDAQGRRVQRRIDGVPERGWIWRSALQPAAQLSPAGAVTQRYVYTNGTSPALIVTPGATYRLIKDHLGSVRRVVDTATGEVVQSLDYDAWGRVLVDSNPGFQPFGYAGGLYDADTGLVRFGARDYDPETGTWLSPEPLGFAAGDNFYAYAAGNPVAYNDPTGLAPSRAELTFLAELFGVGSTASMINERDASIEAVSHGDIGKAECHAAAAASASVGAVVEIGMLAATRGTGAHGHHSYPRFLGGPEKQRLTRLPVQKHRQLHRDMNRHLQQVTDPFGRSMAPSRSNPGREIRERFSEGERRDAVREFYRQFGDKYPEAARDFFEQFGR